MNKFWMMGGTVIAVSVAAMVWNLGPVRSSENLLGRAQLEFAVKARDALIQRQMAQASVAPLSIAMPKTEAPSPYVVASLEPVAPPTATARELRLEEPAAEPQAAVEPKSELKSAVEPKAAIEPATATVASVEAPIALQATVSSPAPAPAAEEAPATTLQVAALEEPKSKVLPKQIDVAPVSEVAKAEAPAVTRTSIEPQRQFKAERKTRHVQRERKANDVYRTERRTPRYATPYSLETLRARSPELAAAIARYM